jgi:transcriptional regulator GlxA family with amidase domain
MPPHRVAILAIPHVIPFNVITPIQVFEHVPDQRYRTFVCSFSKGLIYNRSGLRIMADYGVEALSYADTILVPGFDTCHQPVPERVLAALRTAHVRGTRLASICTGAFVLAQAGLLDRQTATTHWAQADELARNYPQIAVDPRVLYTDNGNIITAAGYTSGVDMCLHIIRKDHGQRIANLVAKTLVASPHRNGGQAQFIDRPVPPERSRRLDRTLQWMLDNLGDNISVTDMARHAGLAARSFARRFEAEIGESPLQWLIEQRVRHAQLLLETTSLPIDTIAGRCGFGTAMSLRLHFKRIAMVTPTDYRKTFGGAEQSGH